MKIFNLLFATAKLWCLPQWAAGSLCSSPNLVAWKCTYISVHDTPGKKKKNIGLWADHCNVQYKVEKKEYMTIHPRSRHRWTFKKWKWHSEWHMEWLVITFFLLELLCLFWKTYWFWIWIKNGRKGKGKHIGKNEFTILIFGIGDKGPWSPVLFWRLRDPRWPHGLASGHAGRLF